MAKVVVEFSASEARLWKAQQRLIAQEMKMEKGYNKVASSANKAATAQARAATKSESGSKRAVAGLKSMAASYLSVQAALQIYNAALAERNRLEDEAKEAKLTVGQSQAQVAKNLAGTTREQKQAFLKSVEGIQQRTGFQSVSSLNQAAGSILSATGGDQAKTLSVLETAAQFFKDAPDDMAQFGGAMADVMKATGSTDARETMALLLAIQGQARFTSLQGFKNVAPAVAAGLVSTKGGGDELTRVKESAALFAAIGSEIADPDGTLTKSAVVAIESNLAAIVPEAKTTFARLERVWSDETGELSERLATQVIAEGGFRKASKNIITDMLSGRDSKATRALQKASANMSSSVEDTEEMASFLRDGTNQLASVTTDAASRGMAEAFDANSGQALSGEVRAIVDRALNRVNFTASLTEGGGNLGLESYLQRGYRKLKFAALSGASGGASPQAGIDALRGALMPLEGVSNEERRRRQVENRHTLEQIEILKDMRDRLAEQANGGQASQRQAAQAEQRQAAIATE